MELSGVLSLLLGVCVSCLLLVASWRKALARRKLPPGPTPLPFVGNILQLDTKALAKSILKFRDTYGPVFTLQLGSERAVVLCGYAAVKEALVDRGKEFGGRGNIATAARITKGFGVIFANGERWRQLRRFSLTTLRNFGMGKRSIEERIQEEAQRLVEELGNTKGSPFDPTFLLGSAVSNVICSIVFGSRFDYQDQEFLTLLSCINQNLRLLSSRWGQLYNAFPALLAALPGRHNAMFHNADTLKRFVSERAKRHRDSLDPSCPDSYIDCFLLQMDQEKQNPDTEFTTENLVMTTLELFFAGTETVSTTLRYGILLLMKYPEIKGRPGGVLRCWPGTWGPWVEVLASLGASVSPSVTPVLGRGNPLVFLKGPRYDKYTGRGPQLVGFGTPAVKRGNETLPFGEQEGHKRGRPGGRGELRRASGHRAGSRGPEKNLAINNNVLHSQGRACGYVPGWGGGEQEAALTNLNRVSGPFQRGKRARLSSGPTDFWPHGGQWSNVRLYPLGTCPNGTHPNLQCCLDKY
ncbi:cytochrome P450 2G1-like, partial [Terrapene carolina triunguis]